MYLDHFGLSEFPFRITPDPAFLYWTADHRRAFSSLDRTARGERAVTMILGEPGTGKTTLLQHFAASLPKNIHVGMISNYYSGLGGLYHWLHGAFGLRPQRSESQLREGFESFLIALHETGSRCVLVLDEAQAASDDDIAALALLTRLPSVPGHSMHLVLAGQPRLRRRLIASSDGEGAESLAPIQLGPMSAEDVHGYIRHRMATAGCSVLVFDETATRHIARLTGGVPRLVNVLCELLLTSAFGAGERVIGEALVDRVLREAWQNGILDHLRAQLGNTALAQSREIPMRKPSCPTGDVSSTAEPALPPVAASQPDVACSHQRPQPPNAAANDPAAPQLVPKVFENDPARRRIRRDRRLFIAASAAGAAIAVIAGSFISLTPSTIAQPKEDPPSAARPVAATIVPVGPSLPLPVGLQGTDASAMHDQALNVGAQDPSAAAIGFARAALRGDDRAAFYLGQHFEAGDGVPRNITLARAWYASASETQRGARRALENLSETPAATEGPASAQPLPIMGIIADDGRAEFVWTASEGSAVGYLVELAEAPGATPLQHGPFELSAALLETEGRSRLWRIVALDAEGARTGASDWHSIEAVGIDELASAP